MVDYYLEKVCGKSDWKVNGRPDHTFLGHTGGTPGAAEHQERFFHMECCSRKFESYRLILISSLRSRFSIHGTELYRW